MVLAVTENHQNRLHFRANAPVFIRLLQAEGGAVAKKFFHGPNRTKILLHLDNRLPAQLQVVVALQIFSHFIPLFSVSV